MWGTSVAVYGSDGNKTFAGAMVESGQLIQKMSQFAIMPLQFLPGIGVLATGADAFMNLVQGNVVGLGLDLLAIGLSGNYGYTYQGGSCFPAGTPLLTPTGDKAIERFRVGDQILSRSELNPEGELETKVVEEVFVRMARIVRMRVNGHEIATTAEHPFWVKGKGWQMVSELRPGDLLSSHDGQWVPVESIQDRGEEATVYNLRIADYHSYFVGARDWGFSVWAHNADYADTFYMANSAISRGSVVVHHAIPQAVLKRYPGLFTRAEIDGLSNLRGIPVALNSKLHLSTINKAWNRFYKKYPNATREMIEQYADLIDRWFGNFFTPSV